MAESREIDLDDEALAEAMVLSDLTTESEVVNQALREFVDRRRRVEQVERFAKLAEDWAPEDGKHHRRPDAKGR